MTVTTGTGSAGTGLSIRGLGVDLGGRHILTSISLDVAPGEYHVILGPSGSGKTTLLRAIAGFEAAVEGEISIDGNLLSTPRSTVAPEKRGVGMQFQSLALWPQWNVLRQIEVVLTQRLPSRQERVKRAGELLELVGLSHLTHRAVHELSGGEAQRLALARALATDPKVLLLDEPLGSVDASLRSELAIELRQLPRRLGVSVLHVTHDQAEGLGVADRVTILRDGRAEQTGTVDDVVRRPESEFVARFIGKHTVLDGTARNGLLTTPLGTLSVKAAREGPVQAAFHPGQVHLGLGSIDAAVTHVTYQPGGWLHRVEAAGAVLYALDARAHPVGSRVPLELRGEPWILPVKS